MSWILLCILIVFLFILLKKRKLKTLLSLNETIDFLYLNEEERLKKLKMNNFVEIKYHSPVNHFFYRNTEKDAITFPFDPEVINKRDQSRESLTSIAVIKDLIEYRLESKHSKNLHDSITAKGFEVQETVSEDEVFFSSVMFQLVGENNNLETLEGYKVTFYNKENLGLFHYKADGYFFIVVYLMDSPVHTISIFS